MKNLLLIQVVWRFFGWTPFDHGLLICVYLESGDLSRMEAYADSYGLSLEWRPSFSCWKALNKKRRTKKQRRRRRRRNFFFFSCFSPTCLLIVVVDDFPVVFWGLRVKILEKREDWKSFHFGPLKCKESGTSGSQVLDNNAYKKKMSHLLNLATSGHFCKIPLKY